VRQASCSLLQAPMMGIALSAMYLFKLGIGEFQKVVYISIYGRDGI